MFPIKYYKADASTYVIKTVNNKIKAKGKGLSFFYNPATTSIAALPINVQEAPFIFGLQTSDFQTVKVQGQVSFRLADAEKTAELLNFTLARDGLSFTSEDPMRLSERVIRSIQTTVQTSLQASTLREALRAVQPLIKLLNETTRQDTAIAQLGIDVMDVSISAITPTPETAKALEAVAREAILKESDDAIYGRRKSSVEQERTIKEAEMETELSVQEKRQEMEERQVENQRVLLKSKALIEQEKLQAEIDRENQRAEFVEQKAENSRIEADAEEYAISARMKAFTLLPVENLKAMTMATMNPDQMMAMAFDNLALNADKIGELSITPDLFGQVLRSGGQNAVR